LRPRLLDAPAKAKLAGLIEEGPRSHGGGKGEGGYLADLALIGAAQRTEHYEIAAYTTTRNLAVQVRDSMIVQLLTASLGEEQHAVQL